MIVCNPLRNSLLLVGAQVCDPLIYCVWHVNFGWLSTNNPTWLQHVSSNICNFFDSFRYSFHTFDVQLFLVGAQVCEVCDPLIDCVWHVNFGWLSTNNSTWLQLVRSNICKKNCPLTSHFVPLSCSYCLPALSAVRYVTHWFLVFGMWISGDYQRTIRHDYRV